MNGKPENLRCEKKSEYERALDLISSIKVPRLFELKISLFKNNIIKCKSDESLYTILL